MEVSEVDSSSLGEGFSSSFINNQDNIILKVDDSEIKCSKQELSNKSEYFQAMFKFKEKKEKIIELHSVEANAVQILVDWVHTNNTKCIENLKEETLFDLLQASNMLQFVIIQEACVLRLMSSLNLQNCFQIKKHADILSERKLFNSANRFCLWNFKKLINLEAFLELELDEVIKYLKDLKINVEREASIVEAILIWISHFISEAGERSPPTCKTNSHFWILITETVIFSRLSTPECEQFVRNDLVQKDKTVMALFQSVIYLKNKEDKNLNENPCDNVNASILTIAKQLLENKNIRQLPRQPCVIGHRLEPAANGSSGCGRHNMERVACVFMYDRRTGRVKEVVEMAKRVRAGWKPQQDEGPVEASGYKAIELDGGFIVLGGEFALGKSNWNSSVLKYCAMEEEWKSLAPLQHPRRHHSLVRVGSKIYLIGGFGKHRIILDTVEVLDTLTGELTECDSLPVPLYRPAAAHFKGRIYVFGKFMACYLEPGLKDTWTKIENVELPRHIEFSTALASDTHIYLTSSHSHELYRFNPNHGQSEKRLEFIGKFSKETHNTTIIDDIIYNFNTEDFDDERVVECYDIDQSKFTVLWKEDCPNMDFSPNYCLGCFPIVSYD